MNRESFAPGEWYHCYTRGVDKRQTFYDSVDYRRFQELLYLCNNSSPVHRSNLKKVVNIYEVKRTSPLVNIAAYSLMPNHFHLLIQENTDNGISTFMKKLGTGYAMYFNRRYERVGNLFVKPFRSKHVIDDAYAKQVSAYIHLNALDIFCPNWEHQLQVLNPKKAEEFLSSFYYSSFKDYLEIRSRNEFSILSPAGMELFQSYQANTSFESLLEHALDFISR